MPMQQLCPVVAAERLNPYACALTLEAGPMAEQARCGQFVHIKCGHSRLLRRPISICDVDGTRLKIVFEVRGEGTEWLSHRRPGATLDVLGPLGHGFDASSAKILVVGGGIGVPPMLYTAKKAAGEVHAVLGFRSADRAMLLDTFTAVCKSVSVASDDGSLGYHGFVDAVAREKLAEGGFTSVLCCGPKPMLRSVARVAEAAGVPCQVSMEERMGCGVGACLVCTCDMKDGTRKHACKDGPVFDSKEVDWDA
ncbi:dihydroorotate dehydrogenase electron transfer subunit [Pseudoflavonifractor sp. MSJ-37]|uniref:dihydroorotate dehydrogenase electron transfer subunit n=1 Tax=Pseudoflavonifractor sp. MSJ-37 TaxID=2841531 RepID=UPI001C126C71|nr:dihydroorotate dehydrogenase electron transfer subunit [Pseudoflavonifractor sp. MSJ-37]MBU5434080.1 dihydroorotate dehydrogenase electron transfer subunit [Pseudoflavonifractor sp. MSJ-37]